MPRLIKRQRRNFYDMRNKCRVNLAEILEIAAVEGIKVVDRTGDITDRVLTMALLKADLVPGELLRALVSYRYGERAEFERAMTSAIASFELSRRRTAS